MATLAFILTSHSTAGSNCFFGKINVYCSIYAAYPASKSRTVGLLGVPEYSGCIHEFYHLKIYKILLTVTKIQQLILKVPILKTFFICYLIHPEWCGIFVFPPSDSEEFFHLTRLFVWGLRLKHSCLHNKRQMWLTLMTFSPCYNLRLWWDNGPFAAERSRGTKIAELESKWCTGTC